MKRDASQDQDTPTRVLLKTKLSPPFVRRDLVARPRLTARLSNGRRLTLLTAPAGFGKTTLLSQWWQGATLPVAWVSLDSGDNDPARFWSYVIGALQTQRPCAGESALALLHQTEPPLADSFLTVLTNEIAATPDELFLVLDDYHTIDNPAIHKGVSQLIEKCPPQLHTVIASRVDPLLSLPHLSGRVQVNEMRTADMTFTPEETANFLNEIMQLGLSGDDIATLERRTEGWIVGLQMAALSLRGRANPSGLVAVFAGDHRHVTDYLMEEVLSRQAAGTLTFLMQTSILERLSGPLCEAVAGLGHGQGQAMLEALDRANLFTVPLDEERRWYRYHHLFAGALQARLRRRQPDQAPELHRRACSWYAAHGLAGEALRHALAAGDFALASALIEEHGETALKRYEVETVLGWLRALPDDLLRARPRLCACFATALILKGLPDAAEEWLDNAERCLALSATEAPLPGEGTTEVERIRGSVIAQRASIAAARRDLPLAIALSRQALEVSSDAGWRAHALIKLGLAHLWNGDAERADAVLTEATLVSKACGNSLTPILALAQLANAHVMQARLPQAAKVFQQALNLAEAQEGPLPPAAVRICLGMAMLHYEWDDLEAGYRYATQGIELAQNGGVLDLVLFGHGVLARLAQAKGDVGASIEALERAERLAGANNVAHGLAPILAYHARLWLRQGDLAAAVRWAQAAGLRADDKTRYMDECQHLVFARVLMAEGKLDDAACLLARLSSAAASAGRIGSLIKVLALEALVHRACGRVNEALRALARALQLASPGRYVRTFLDEGAPLVELLSEIPKPARRRFLDLSGDLHCYARDLVASFGPSHTPAGGRPSGKQPSRGAGGEAGTEPLSDRELDVLALVAAGRSRLDIARALIVSVNTVNTHAKSIFGKLDVHSGREAVAKARAAGLL